LQAIGYTNSNLHIRYDDKTTGVYNFKHKPITLSHAEELACFEPMPLEKSLSMIKNGEFAVGHLPPLTEVKNEICGKFKIILLVRDLRNCLISHMRYMIKTEAISTIDHTWINIPDKRERFKQYLSNYADPVGPLVHMKLISCWEFDIHDPYPGMELLKLRFEDLITKDKKSLKKTLTALENFLGNGFIIPINEYINQVLNKPTLTQSDGLTVLDEFWSAYAERWFMDRISTNGVDINKFIGYQ